jgi:hypothetical protein
MPYETDIYSYIIREEAAYRKDIPVNDVWKWGMYKHILQTDLYSNSQLLNGKDEFTPVKNITRSILNVQHRTEDLNVTDVQVYVNDPDKYHLSFLVKKYHDDVFAVENDLDTFFDELNISRIDYGGGLSKKLNKPAPERVPLQSIVFCDQSDMLSAPIGLKHYYSPDQLLAMRSKGWGKKSNGATITIEDLIKLSRSEKVNKQSGTQVETPGRYIEVYEVHGNLPKKFANKDDQSGEYETRIFIVAFYAKKDSQEKAGVILYTAPEPELPFKLIKRDPVHGRALGFGGAEELFEAQVWVNYDMIRMQDMLDAASKTILKSTDPTVTQKSKVRDMENLTVVNLQPGTDLGQVDTFPRNISLFERSITEWETHAKDMGAAQDTIQGKEPTAGTPFASVQAQIQQSMGLHDYRRGIFAKHLEEIYQDWIIPHIEKKITEGTTFLSQLSLEELQTVMEGVVTYQTNEFIKENILSGNITTQQQIDQYKQQAMQTFQKKGNKHFIKILKGEFKDAPLAVRVVVAGKSKDLYGMVDKLTNVFKTVISNPYILQAPPIAKLFNKIIEASGLDPIDLSGFNVPSSPATKLSETINYADLDPQSQQALLEKAGIKANQPAPTAPQLTQ